jgi:hypothetical protein
MAAERQALAAGVPPVPARQLNPMSSRYDRGLGEAWGRGAVELPGALGGAAAMLGAPTYDAYRGLTGQGWDTAAGAERADVGAIQKAAGGPFESAALGSCGDTGRTIEYPTAHTGAKNAQTRRNHAGRCRSFGHRFFARRLCLD